MKKLLLGSSMLAAVALATSAQADTPKITVGGVIDWQVGIISDDTDNTSSHAFRNDTEISFNVDGKAQNGLGYGAVIVLEADVSSSVTTVNNVGGAANPGAFGGIAGAGTGLNASSDTDDEGFNASKTYIYLDGSWGRVELGSNVGPSTTLEIDAASIARGTGGIDGDWYFFVNPTGAGATHVITPDLPLAFGINTGGFGAENQENLNRITYYSPRLSGFQLGVSYAANDRNRGQGIDLSDNNIGRADQIFTGALNYEGNYNGFGVGAAANIEYGNAEASTTEDLLAWSVGGVLSYQGFSIAGSYADWDDSLSDAALAPTVGELDSADFFTLGAAYEHGPYGISVTYIDSSFDTVAGDNDFENIVVSADYQLAPGLTPYAEISFFDAESDVVADNDGTVFLFGTQLNF